MANAMKSCNGVLLCEEDLMVLWSSYYMWDKMVPESGGSALAKTMLFDLIERLDRVIWREPVDAQAIVEFGGDNDEA